MWKQRDYLETAKRNEVVFRNILRGINPNILKARELDLEAPIDKIYEKYSTGDRYGRWTILDFRVGPSNSRLAPLEEDEALFASEDIAMLSGSGSVNKFKIGPDDSVKFDSTIISWRS